MNETSKSKKYWEGHYALQGTGLDIGAGSDCLPNATGWDITSRDRHYLVGDAHTLKGIPDNSYDFVYSSHCLEHMRDVPLALKNWMRVVRPGGYLYIVVPCFIRYEHRFWPSRFNQDHKQTFVSGMVPNSGKILYGPNHWVIAKEGLFSRPHTMFLNIQDIMIQDDNLDYELLRNQPEIDQTLGDALAQIRFIIRK